MLRRRLPVPLFALASLVLHAGLYVWIRFTWGLPDAGFKLTLPDTIELGMVEGTQLVETPAAAAAEPPQPAQPTPQPAAATSEPKPPGDEPAKPKPPRKPKPAGPPIDPAVREAVAKNGLAAISPPGAQLALRIDLAALRDSPLSEDVRALLDGIPDVRALLDGSEIDLLRDVSRLFLASPNLQRSKVVMAGRYVGDESLPRRAAENLARIKGTSVEWRSQGNVPVVSWENPDATERVLALIGPSLFSITRADDLPRVLGIARALAQRSKRARGDGDALLEMGAGQVVSFTVENAKLFARGATEHVPERLVVAAHAPEHEMLRLTAQAEYATERDAEHAAEFWENMRQRYARSPLLAVFGLRGLLERTGLQRKGTQLALESSLQLSEARLILRVVRDSLASRRPGPGPTGGDPKLAR
ncbi:MAG TPA: hypothetical protein VJR89_13105 [Polyangiales bacterium]|nr:hypothetical protein [Polyangiales bacterium]